MQEYKIKVDTREYCLNNNSGKYDRVFDPKIGFGKNPTNEQLLAYYDKFSGLILDENRKKIENGKFWEEYEAKLTNDQKKVERKKAIWRWLAELAEKIKALWSIGMFLIVVVFALGYLFDFIDSSTFLGVYERLNI
jgi:hypothetical protein